MAKSTKHNAQNNTVKCFDAFYQWLDVCAPLLENMKSSTKPKVHSFVIAGKGLAYSRPQR